MNLKILICILHVFTAFALDKGVYDDDDRTDFNDLVNLEHREWALSTAAMIGNHIVRDQYDGTSLIKSKTLGQLGICERERFSRQLTAADCTGFLVGDDTLVGAGALIAKSIEAGTFVYGPRSKPADFTTYEKFGINEMA